MIGSHEQKCHEPSAVYSLISNARGPGTKDQTEVESRWRVCAVPTTFLVTLLQQVLRLNIFEFDEKLYIQKFGTAMGTCAALTYANLFMADKDNSIKNVQKTNFPECALELYFRFIVISLQFGVVPQKALCNLWKKSTNYIRLSSSHLSLTMKRSLQHS
jgi:hypothetical protein